MFMNDEARSPSSHVRYFVSVDAVEIIVVDRRLPEAAAAPDGDSSIGLQLPCCGRDASTLLVIVVVVVVVVIVSSVPLNAPPMVE